MLPESNNTLPARKPLSPAQVDELAFELLMTAQSLHQTANVLEAAAARIRPPRPAPPVIAPVYRERAS